MEVPIQSDIINSRMNKIISNKNVSSAKKKTIETQAERQT
jgi:hypothetical protein